MKLFYFIIFIIIADDEDSEDENNEEVIDLHDNIDDDEDSNIVADNIAYDSEENEIELVDDDSKCNIKKIKFTVANITNFFNIVHRWCKLEKIEAFRFL